MINNYVTFTSQLLLLLHFVCGLATVRRVKKTTTRIRLTVVGVTSNYKALADNASNELFASFSNFFNHFLMSTATEGRGGGGGHGG